MGRQAIDLVICEEPIARLAEHASISIAFTVDRVFHVSPRAADGGFDLREQQLAAPYVKDYDAIAGNHPSQWARRFDMANWGLLAAHVGSRRAGGGLVALRTAGLDMLEGRDDLAVLWDLRVAPELRGQGIGAGLFAAAEEWARARGSRTLKVETQNVNVPACRFYERRGCALRAAHHFAYPELPHEIQLLWYKDLIDAGGDAGGGRRR